MPFSHQSWNGFFNRWRLFRYHMSL